MTLKEQFPFFYRRTKDEVDNAFKTGWLVFDTSSLLNIYELGLADKVYDLLERNADRIKIPYHVAEEYHKDVNSTIAKQLSYTKNGICELEKKDDISAFRNKYKKYFTNSTVADFSKQLDKLYDKFAKNIQKQHDYLKTQYQDGILQNKLSTLLGDKLLSALPEDRITEIETKIGPDRYGRNVAPGYEDAGKEENKYGDLIIWMEILEFAKNTDKDIIFICDDVKEDILYKPSGYTFGPHISMLKEFYEANPQIHYHLCTLETFIHHANKVNKVMTDSEVEQIRTDMKAVTEESVVSMPKTVVTECFMMPHNPSQFVSFESDNDRKPYLNFTDSSTKTVVSSIKSSNREPIEETKGMISEDNITTDIIEPLKNKKI